MARSGRFADASANGIDVAFAGRRLCGVRRTSTRGLSLLGCAPRMWNLVQLEIDADLDLLDVALELKGAGSGEARKRFIAEPKKIIFELCRPIGSEGIFEAATDQPTTGGIGCADRGTGCQLCDPGLVADPATTSLDVDQGAVQGEADAAGQRGDPLGVRRRVQRAGDARQGNIAGGIDRGPIEIPLDAEHEVSHLVIVADLNAADEPVVVPIKAHIVEVIVQAGRGPGAANVSTKIKSGPGEGWRQGNGIESGGAGVIGAVRERTRCQSCEHASTDGQARTRSFDGHLARISI